MDDKVLLSLLLCGLCVAGAHEIIREFHFVNAKSSWSEAQRFCRRHYTDLATPRHADDLGLLLRPPSYAGLAWIGLRYEAGTGYQKWRPGRPAFQNLCLSLNIVNAWYDDHCPSRLPFLCYSDSDVKHYTKHHVRRTWAEARVFCREHYTDLAVIESEAEHNQAYRVAGAENSWMNTFGNWSWSDGSLVLFSNWPPPGVAVQGLLDSSCTAEEQGHLWKRVSCEEKLPFFCYGDIPPTLQASVKVSIRSTLDLSDPNNRRLLTQKIEKELSKLKSKVIWKSAPEKQTESSTSPPKECPMSVE